MDNEKMNELAERYADKECEQSSLEDKELLQLHEDKILEFYNVWGFLLETHCIVEKNEARETLEELKEDARPVCEWDEKVVDVVTLEDTFIYLFGKELFNDNEK